MEVDEIGTPTARIEGLHSGLCRFALSASA
jgi:hypothetical protein